MSRWVSRLRRLVGIPASIDFPVLLVGFTPAMFKSCKGLSRIVDSSSDPKLVTIFCERFFPIPGIPRRACCANAGSLGVISAGGNSRGVRFLRFVSAIWGFMSGVLRGIYASYVSIFCTSCAGISCLSCAGISCTREGEDRTGEYGTRGEYSLACNV